MWQAETLSRTRLFDLLGVCCCWVKTCQRSDLRSNTGEIRLNSAPVFIFDISFRMWDQDVRVLLLHALAEFLCSEDWQVFSESCRPVFEMETWHSCKGTVHWEQGARDYVLALVSDEHLVPTCSQECDRTWGRAEPAQRCGVSARGTQSSYCKQAEHSAQSCFQRRGGGGGRSCTIMTISCLEGRCLCRRSAARGSVNASGWIDS